MHSRVAQPPGGFLGSVPVGNFVCCVNSTEGWLSRLHASAMGSPSLTKKWLCGTQPTGHSFDHLTVILKGSDSKNTHSVSFHIFGKLKKKCSHQKACNESAIIPTLPYRSPHTNTQPSKLFLL